MLRGLILKISIESFFFSCFVLRIALYSFSAVGTVPHIVLISLLDTLLRSQSQLKILEISYFPASSAILSLTSMQFALADLLLFVQSLYLRKEKSYFYKKKVKVRLPHWNALTSPAMCIKVAQYLKIYGNWLITFTEKSCSVHVLKNKP